MNGIDRMNGIDTSLMSEATRAWLDAGGPEEFEIEGQAFHWSCFTGDLGLCGCGAPETAADRLLGILRRIKESQEWTAHCKGPRPHEYGSEVGVDPNQDEGLYWLLWYWIDDRGWIEHGSSVRGSWLTQEGERAIEVLEACIRLDG